MKLQQLLKEAFQSPESAIDYLKNLALTGELDKEKIDGIYRDLLSSRKKMFTSKITPDQRSASVEKGKITKQLKQIATQAHNELAKLYKLNSNDKQPDAFALSIGMHKNKDWQKEYNQKLLSLAKKYAKEVGITDDELIKKAL